MDIMGDLGYKLVGLLVQRTTNEWDWIGFIGVGGLCSKCSVQVSTLGCVTRVAVVASWIMGWKIGCPIVSSWQLLLTP